MNHGGTDDDDAADEDDDADNEDDEETEDGESPLVMLTLMRYHRQGRVRGDEGRPAW